MKAAMRILIALVATVALGGCAIGQRLGWHRSEAVPTAVVVASCDAATASLKGRPDHGVAHEACVEAKTRQNVD